MAFFGIPNTGISIFLFWARSKITKISKSWESGLKNSEKIRVLTVFWPSRFLGILWNSRYSGFLCEFLNFYSRDSGLFYSLGILSLRFGIFLSLGIFIPGIRGFHWFRDFYPRDSGFLSLGFGIFNLRDISGIFISRLGIFFRLYQINSRNIF